MARDVAKKVSGKIKQEAGNQQSKGKDNNNSNKSNLTQLKEKTVTGSRVRKLVASELRDRNRSDIAESYSGSSRKYITRAKSKRSTTYRRYCCCKQE